MNSQEKKKSEAQRITALEKKVEKLQEQIAKMGDIPTMYELMGFTNPNAAWIGKGYRDIQDKIKKRREAPIAEGEIDVV